MRNILDATTLQSFTCLHRSSENENTFKSTWQCNEHFLFATSKVQSITCIFAVQMKTQMHGPWACGPCSKLCRCLKAVVVFCIRTRSAISSETIFSIMIPNIASCLLLLTRSCWWITAGETISLYVWGLLLYYNNLEWILHAHVRGIARYLRYQHFVSGFSAQFLQRQAFWYCIFSLKNLNHANTSTFGVKKKNEVLRMGLSNSHNPISPPSVRPAVVSPGTTRVVPLSSFALCTIL